MLIGLAIVILLAACGGATPTPAAELTSTPTPAPAPTSTPMPIPTGTPTPSPSSTPASTADSTPTPTPEPAELGVAGFLQQCEQATLALATPFMGGAIDLNQMAQSDDITWGNIADIYASAVDAYGELNPPDELQEYHSAWLRTGEGNHYVEVTVWSDDTGSYVLTVSNVDDGHGNSLATASTAVVGQPVQVSIGYDGDLDYLVFQAEEGQSYQISVELGTVSEASLTLYDVDRFLQAFGPGPIDWEAPASGDYYVEATAFGETGTYSVSVTASGS